VQHIFMELSETCWPILCFREASLVEYMLACSRCCLIQRPPLVAKVAYDMPLRALTCLQHVIKLFVCVRPWAECDHPRAESCIPGACSSQLISMVEESMSGTGPESMSNTVGSRPTVQDLVAESASMVQVQVSALACFQALWVLQRRQFRLTIYPQILLTHVLQHYSHSPASGGCHPLWGPPTPLGPPHKERVMPTYATSFGESMLGCMKL
jgi:hypothetical protein